MRSRLAPLLCALLSLLAPGLAAAVPEGTLTIAMHFSPVTRWLDPAEGESTITPYLMLAARILAEQVIQAPVYHLGFPIGVGPRVEDILATAIPGFYMSPYEDLKLRRP